MDIQLTNIDAWQDVLGRAHVVLVHFPVGMLIVAAVVELFGALFSRRSAGDDESPRSRPSSAVMTMLTFGVLGAAFACVSGWTYADTPFADDPPLQGWHRWLGISAGGVAVLALLCGAIARASGGGRSIGIFRLLILAGAILVGFAGHYGGSMVHGENHVFAPLFTSSDSSTTPSDGTGEDPNDSGDDTDSAPPTTIDDGTGTTTTSPPAGIVFASDVQPIFESECYRCHGPRRQRGNLRLDLPGLLAERIKAGDVIVAGDPDASELVRRVSLPADDFDHMPPGDESLTAEQITIISNWIAQGALLAAVGTVDSTQSSDDASEPPAASGNDDTTGDSESSTTATTPEPDQLPSIDQAQASVRDAAIGALVERGAHARVIAANTDAVEVDFSMLSEEVTDADLNLLTGLESSLAWLDCSNTSVGDSGVASLTPFKQVRRIDLADTAITDAAIESLAQLPRLERVNLIGTAVTDSGVMDLRSLPHLRRIYLWRSQVTANGAAGLRATNPQIETVLGD